MHAKPSDTDPAPRSVVDHQVARIAERLRRWREQTGLTFQELARRSGVSASTIHKIEMLQMVPTITVLLKIAKGLDRQPSELVRDTDAAEVVHLRPGARSTTELVEFMVAERLSGDLFDPTLEAWRITVPAGSGRDRIRFDGEALILCEEGNLSCHVGENTYELTAGDSLHFIASLPHGWRNQSKQPARFLLVGAVPRVLRAALHEPREGPVAGDVVD